MPQITTNIKFRDKAEANICHRVNPIERHIITEIWTHETYFKEGLEIKEGDNVVDIGGHIGIFSVLAGKLGANVITFEPLKSSYGYLLKNIKDNGLEDRVKPFNLAVTADGRDIRMYEENNNDKWNTGRARVYGEGEGDPEKEKVKSKTLDTIYRDNGLYQKGCDFLKVDCEGAEYEAFYGTTPSIFDSTRQISMEFHHSLQEGKMLANYLERRNYDVRLKWAYAHIGMIYAKRK
jgi:FkbM family methyltransferase